MRIVILGDIHVYRLWLPPWRLLNKAMLGQANLLLQRRKHLDLSLLAPVVNRATALRPDLVLLSGDFTTTSQPEEFADARAALAPLTSGARTVAVPGNHDRYTGRALRSRAMESSFAAVMPREFPHVERVAPGWHLLAMDSAVPRWASSRGRLGERQLSEAKGRIAALGREERLIVMTHYAIGKPPPLPPSRPSHRLEDEAALLELLRGCHASVLFVHGHIHCPWLWQRPEPELAHVVDLNAGAPCLTGRGFRFGQGFWQVDLADDANPRATATCVHHLPIKHPAQHGEEAWMTATNAALGPVKLG